jgi:hypothetical protein
MYLIKSNKVMERVIITPCDLYAVGYDLEKQILEIQFINGSVYQYNQVPFKVYGHLLSSGFDSRVSIGNYFDSVIRDNYQSRHIGHEPIKINLDNEDSDIEEEENYEPLPPIKIRVQGSKDCIIVQEHIGERYAIYTKSSPNYMGHVTDNTITNDYKNLSFWRGVSENGWFVRKLED